MLAPIDTSNIRLETERLILRPWTEDDLADLYAYASVDGVGQMAGWTPHKNPRESKAILDLFIRGRRTLALELKDNGKVIGSLGIEEMRPDPVEGQRYGRELGYVLSKQYWGRGLMPEAVAAVIDYCFRVLRYDYLTCGHFVWNAQSRRVIEKCGFHYICDGEYQTKDGTMQPSRNYILYNPQLENQNV